MVQEAVKALEIAVAEIIYEPGVEERDKLLADFSGGGN